MMVITVLLWTPKILQSEHCAWRFCQLKFLGRTGSKRTHHIHTQHSGGALLIAYLHPNGVVRVGWEPSATNDSFMAL